MWRAAVDRGICYVGLFCIAEQEPVLCWKAFMLLLAP